jgi:hypothetical protein
VTSGYQRTISHDHWIHRVTDVGQRPVPYVSDTSWGVNEYSTGCQTPLLGFRGRPPTGARRVLDQGETSPGTNVSSLPRPDGARCDAPGSIGGPLGKPIPGPSVSRARRREPMHGPLASPPEAAVPATLRPSTSAESNSTRVGNPTRRVMISPGLPSPCGTPPGHGPCIPRDVSTPFPPWRRRETRSRMGPILAVVAAAAVLVLAFNRSAATETRGADRANGCGRALSS